MVTQNDTSSLTRRLSQGTLGVKKTASLLGAHAKRFRGSQCILGTYDQKGLLHGRDGATLIDDPNAFFGAEWQIKVDENMLFHAIHRPRYYPQECQLPAFD